MRFVLFRPDEGLVESFGSGASSVAVFAFVGLDLTAGGRGGDGECGGLTGPYPKQAEVEFKALDGGDFADRGGS